MRGLLPGEDGSAAPQHPLPRPVSSVTSLPSTPANPAGIKLAQNGPPPPPSSLLPAQPLSTRKAPLAKPESFQLLVSWQKARGPRNGLSGSQTGVRRAGRAGSSDTSHPAFSGSQGAPRAPPPGPLHLSPQSQPPGQKAVTLSPVGQARSARVGPHQVEAGTCLGT